MPGTDTSANDIREAAKYMDGTHLAGKVPNYRYAYPGSTPPSEMRAFPLVLLFSHHHNPLSYRDSGTDRKMTQEIRLPAHRYQAPPQAPPGREKGRSTNPGTGRASSPRGGYCLEARLSSCLNI